ncbi:probetacellulin isoform 2-T2 [Syngnathus typhle]
MAKVYGLYVAILTVLALHECSLASCNATDKAVNQTEGPCHRQGNEDNCTAPTLDTGQWNGHFSKCPHELHHYCIHGECRYIKDQKTPSCRCQYGYIGSRCEYVDLDGRIGERKQIIIICVIAALVSQISMLPEEETAAGGTEERDGETKHDGSQNIGLRGAFKQ